MKAQSGWKLNQTESITVFRSFSILIFYISLQLLSNCNRLLISLPRAQGGHDKVFQPRAVAAAVSSQSSSLLARVQ